MVARSMIAGHLAPPTISPRCSLRPAIREDISTRLALAEELRHVLEAGPELAAVAGPPPVLEDAYDVPAHALCMFGAVRDLGRDRLRPQLSRADSFRVMPAPVERVSSRLRPPDG